ncbi:MAG: IS1 family transposase [Alphaproteobacteria bacterium]|nr:IS1 family transposase [Alphaproteobacteria bacterium]MBQ9234866.1 IS1 family transposase [Alphaproteobacteria bacterium]
MDIKCNRCGGEQIVKNGHVFGWQRYKCKHCGFQFSKVAPAGKPMHIKLIAHGLYSAGFSMREAAGIIGVTAQTVSRWIKKWHSVYMNDIGRHKTIYAADAATLNDCLQAREGEKILVSSMVLPSGAKFNIVIQLPSQNH